MRVRIKYQSFLNGFGDYMMDLYITRLVLMLGGATITPLFLAIAVDDNNH